MQHLLEFIRRFSLTLIVTLLVLAGFRFVLHLFGYQPTDADRSLALVVGLIVLVLIGLLLWRRR